MALIRDLLIGAKQQLTAYDTAALDAEILLAHVLQITRAQLYASAEQPVNSAQEKLFTALIARHVAGEPVAYIIGYREFWSLSIKVTADTLIPRPETEHVVECVLRKLPHDKPCKVADLGTGSGAIALALASECPRWNLVATDKMPAALQVARQNATRLQLNNIQFYQGSWCEALGSELYDAIVSNPPYIDDQGQYWRDNLNLFEPRTALLAEEAGLADLHTIIRQAPQHLKPGGWLVLEHGYDQGNAVKQLLIQYGYNSVESQHDLANIARVVVAQVR